MAIKDITCFLAGILSVSLLPHNSVSLQHYCQVFSTDHDTTMDPISCKFYASTALAMSCSVLLLSCSYEYCSFACIFMHMNTSNSSTHTNYECILSCVHFCCRNKCHLKLITLIFKCKNNKVALQKYAATQPATAEKVMRHEWREKKNNKVKWMCNKFENRKKKCYNCAARIMVTLCSEMGNRWKKMAQHDIHRFTMPLIAIMVSLGIKKLSSGLKKDTGNNWLFKKAHPKLVQEFKFLNVERFLTVTNPGSKQKWFIC